MPDFAHAEAMILTDLDCHVVKNADTSHRAHLGASVIGDECMRKLWYGFRWVALKRFPGRMHRLFQRGHDEEPKIVGWLRQAGWEVWDTDPTTGRQFRFTAIYDHFGGSLDAIGRPSERSQYAWLNWCVLEFKTANAKSWAELNANGVKDAQSRHWAQMQLYCHHTNLRYAVYLSVNKNTDELYCEVVEADKSAAEDLLRKAQMIIFDPEIPPRISEDPTWYKCKFCDFQRVCHHGAEILRNCRSCVNGKPDVNGTWFCQFYNATIPKDQLNKDHECWSSIV